MSGLRVSPETRRDAISAASAKFGIAPGAIASKQQARAVAHARQYAMWLMRQRKRADGRAAHSYPTIGLAMGVDHTTALHAVRQVEKRLAMQSIPKGENVCGRFGRTTQEPIVDNPNRESMSA